MAGMCAAIPSYVTALDNAYTRYREKYSRKRSASVSRGPVKDANVAAFNLLDDVDYPVFHSPYGKLVQKAHARIVSTPWVLFTLG